MKIEKILEYLNNAEFVRYLYAQPKYKCSHIARTLKLSETTVNNMLMKKYPKSVVKYLASTDYQI